MDHTRDLMRSVQVMELVDEIDETMKKLLELSGLDPRRELEYPRSEILVSALRDFSDGLKADLEAAERQGPFE